MLQHTRNHDNLTIVVLEIWVVSLRSELFRESQSCGFNYEYLQVGAVTEAYIELPILLTFLIYFLHIPAKNETFHKTNTHTHTN